MHAMNHSLAGSKQRGAVLIVSLVMLLLLTFIGVAAMNTSNVQEKMVGNLQDQQVAFEMAELALHTGEQWILNYAGLPEESTDPAPGDSQVWAIGAIRDKLGLTKAAWWEDATDASFWTAEGNKITLDTSLVRSGTSDSSWYVYQQPAYVIEKLTTISGTSGVGSMMIGQSEAPVQSSLYRLVARGMGGRSDTVILLEGIYGKQ